MKQIIDSDPPLWYGVPFLIDFVPSDTLLRKWSFSLAGMCFGANTTGCGGLKNIYRWSRVLGAMTHCLSLGCDEKVDSYYFYRLY